MAKSLFRVMKNGKPTGKWVVKKQSGASGRTVFSVQEKTYKKGKKAASDTLRSRRDYEPTGS